MLKSEYATRRVLMVVCDQAQVLDVTGPLEVFGAANQLMASLQPDRPPPYQLLTVAEDVGPVQVSSGMRLYADRSYHGYRGKVDTLLIAGGGGVFAALENEKLLRFLKRMISGARRSASICTGAFLLARTGALNGRKVTTHWRYAQRLKDAYPELEVDVDAIFVKQGNLYTSAGVTAGIDLALEMVKEDLGKAVALRVARELVVFLSRPGGQSQFSQYLESQGMGNEDFSELTQWLMENLDQTITVETMANRCHMSPRHFARQFREKMDTTPAKYLEQLRMEHSRLLLDEKSIPLKTVIHRSGFVSHEHFRRCFRRHFNINPQDYRNRF